MTPYSRTAGNKDQNVEINTELAQPANKRATSEEIFFLGLSAKDAKRIQAEKPWEDDDDTPVHSEALTTEDFTPPEEWPQSAYEL